MTNTEIELNKIALASKAADALELFVSSMPEINLDEAADFVKGIVIGRKIKEDEDEAKQAFSKAIAEGRLSEDKNAPNYAGAYMYMGKGKGGDSFKHRLTRDYLAPKGWNQIFTTERGF